MKALGISLLIGLAFGSHHHHHHDTPYRASPTLVAGKIPKKIIKNNHTHEDELFHLPTFDKGETFLPISSEVLDNDDEFFGIHDKGNEDKPLFSKEGEKQHQIISGKMQKGRSILHDSIEALKRERERKMRLNENKRLGEHGYFPID